MTRDPGTAARYFDSMQVRAHTIISIIISIVISIILSIIISIIVSITIIVMNVKTLIIKISTTTLCLPHQLCQQEHLYGCRCGAC